MTCSGDILPFRYAQRVEIACTYKRLSRLSPSRTLQGAWLERQTFYEWLEPLLWLLRAVGEGTPGLPALPWPEKGL